MKNISCLTLALILLVICQLTIGVQSNFGTLKRLKINPKATNIKCIYLKLIFALYYYSTIDLRTYDFLT